MLAVEFLNKTNMDKRKKKIEEHLYWLLIPFCENTGYCLITFAIL